MLTPSIFLISDIKFIKAMTNDNRNIFHRPELCLSNQVDEDGEKLSIDDLFDDILFRRYDGTVAAKKRQILDDILQNSHLPSPFFIAELLRYAHLYTRSGDYELEYEEQKTWSTFLGNILQIFNTSLPPQGISMWTYFFENNLLEKKILQIKSLDQMKELSTILPCSSVACGYCAIFNAEIFYSNFWCDENREQITDYLFLPDKECAQEVVNTIGKSEKFSDWAEGARNTLHKYYTAYLVNRLNAAIIKNSLSEEKRKLFEAYNIEINDIRLIEEFDTYITELATIMINDMLFQEDLRRLIRDSCPDLDSHSSYVSLTELLAHARTFFEKGMDAFLWETGIADFFSGMRSVRFKHKNHVVFLETGKNHWITIIFTPQAMFIIDSLNKDRRFDKDIRLLHDIFYSMPENFLPE